MQQFQYIAAIFIFAGIASAIVIAADLRSCPQRMRIMRSVWILTGLWATLIGLKAYFAFGRPKRCSEGYSAQRFPAPDAPGTPASETPGTERPAEEPLRPGMHPAAGTQSMRAQEMHTVQTTPGMENMRETSPTEERRGTEDMPEMHGMQRTEDMPEMRGMEMAGAMEARPRWQSVVLSTLHCGAGCTLADLVGEWFLYFVPVSVAGSLIAGTWIVDYLLALLFGIGFQYAAIREMEPRVSKGDILRRAAKADILSLTAWQAGMYGWMALVIFVFNGGAPPDRATFGFWFMMQIAMACGFAVSLPVNLFLIRKGIKHGM